MANLSFVQCMLMKLIIILTLYIPDKFTFLLYMLTLPQHFKFNLIVFWRKDIDGCNKQRIPEITETSRPKLFIQGTRDYGIHVWRLMCTQKNLNLSILFDNFRAMKVTMALTRSLGTSDFAHDILKYKEEVFIYTTFKVPNFQHYCKNFRENQVM